MVDIRIISVCNTLIVSKQVISKPFKNKVTNKLLA